VRDELGQPMARAPAERQHASEGPADDAAGVEAARAQALLRELSSAWTMEKRKGLAPLGHQGVRAVHDERSQQAVQLALHHFRRGQDDFPLAEDPNDGEHVGEGAARRGPLPTTFAFHLRVDVEQEGRHQRAHLAGVVPDLVGGEQRVEADQGCKLLPMRPGRFVLLARAVRGAEVR
jgi:hypothetical protein